MATETIPMSVLMKALAFAEAVKNDKCADMEHRMEAARVVGRLAPYVEDIAERIKVSVTTEEANG